MLETPKPETPKPETPKPETAEPETDSPPAATTGEPADPQRAKPGTEERNGTTAEAAQELPLDEAAPLRPAGAVRKAPARKAAPKKAPESGGSTKRAAAAVTETPGRVVAVPSADRARSMPPTDLDAVAVIDVSDAIDDEIVLVDEPTPSPTEPEEHDAPTGPISLRERPQPAPLGARPAPPGGPPAE
jgi:hypothetical protein